MWASNVRFLLAMLLASSAYAADTTIDLFQEYGSQAVTPHGTGDTMCCATVVSRLGIVGAVKFGGELTSACGSGTAGWALYPDDDTADAIVSTSAACTSAGAKVATVSSYTIQAGKRYRVCYCSSATTGNFLGVDNASGALNTLNNSFNTFWGKATNGCTSGVPDTTGTGAISTDTACSLVVTHAQ